MPASRSAGRASLNDFCYDFLIEACAKRRNLKFRFYYTTAAAFILDNNDVPLIAADMYY